MYPAYIHTQTTARNIDHAAIKTYQIPSLILMEHAALTNHKYKPIYLHSLRPWK